MTGNFGGNWGNFELRTAELDAETAAGLVCTSRTGSVNLSSRVAGVHIDLEISPSVRKFRGNSLESFEIFQ
jgi:hypothetical protein